MSKNIMFTIDTYYRLLGEYKMHACCGVSVAWAYFVKFGKVLRLSISYLRHLFSRSQLSKQYRNLHQPRLIHEEKIKSSTEIPPLIEPCKRISTYLFCYPASATQQPNIHPSHLLRRWTTHADNPPTHTDNPPTHAEYPRKISHQFQS